MSAPTRHHPRRSRWRIVGVFLSSIVLAAGCGGESTTDDPASETASSSSYSTRTSTSQSTTTATTPETESVERQSAPAITPAAVGPTLVECIYGGGAWTETGWMSDGSYRYHPQCAALRSEQLALKPYVCPQTDHHVADLSECLYPTGIPVSPAAPGPSVVDEPTVAEEPPAPPVEPGGEAEPGAEPVG